MKDLTTISTDLFNKVRSRFSKISMGDEEGALITEPENARFFDITYTHAGEKLGRVNLKIDDDSLTVIYDESMTDGEPENVRGEWFDFLKELRQFARKNLLKFDTRDIAKSNLEKRDYKYLAKKSGEKEMSESKLFGTSKTSYQDVGEAKIIVKHSAPVNYSNPAGRTQRIESIYIESSTGERFRYPAKHLNGARAMAVHVANGGTPYDPIGSHISGLSEELSKLRQFKNYTHRSGVMAEALGDISERVEKRIDAVKNEVASLQKQGYYEQFREGFAPSEAQEVPEDMVNSWVDALTIKTFNEELKGVFPYIYKLVSEKRDGELNYEDLVAEGEKCPVCNESPCVCDSEDDEDVKEHSLFADFENQLEATAKLDHEQEYAEEASAPAVTISTEVVEFIKSMYDSQTGTFPRGEEGVKIACEKKFGEQAGQFAHYVVEKLSGAVAGGIAGAALTKTPAGAMAGAELGSNVQDALSGDDEVEEGFGSLETAVTKLLQRFDQNANEINAWGDPDVKKIVALLQQGNAEAAAEEVWYAYTDQDGGEVPQIEPYVDDLQGDFEALLQSGGDEEQPQESAELLTIRQLAGL